MDRHECCTVHQHQSCAPASLRSSSSQNETTDFSILPVTLTFLNVGGLQRLPWVLGGESKSWKWCLWLLWLPPQFSFCFEFPWRERVGRTDDEEGSRVCPSVLGAALTAPRKRRTCSSSTMHLTIVSHATDRQSSKKRRTRSMIMHGSSCLLPHFTPLLPPFQHQVQQEHSSKRLYLHRDLAS